MDVPTPETAATIPNRAPGLLRATVDDEQIVHDPAQQRTHRLNPTAALVLDRCDGTTAVDAVCAALAAEFAVPPSQLAAEVAAVLDDFARNGLVVSDRDPTSVEAAAPLGVVTNPGDMRALPDEAVHVRRFATPIFCALDAAVQVTTDDAGIARRVDEVLGSVAEAGAVPPSAPAAGGSSVYELVAVARGIDVRFDGRTIGNARSPDVALSLLQWHLNGVASRHAGEQRLLLHASAVRLPDGRVAVFAGEANAGKSTLAAGLVRAGYGYLTDETVAVDIDSGRAEGYRKPINLDPGSWALFDDLADRPDDEAGPERLIDPVGLHADALAGPAAGDVALIVFPTYADGAATTAEPIGRAETVVHLIAHCTNVADHGDAGLEALVALTASAPAFALTSGDLDAAVAAIGALVEPDSPDSSRA